MKNNMEQVSHVEKRRLYTMSWYQEPLIKEARPHGNCSLPMVKEHNARNILECISEGLPLTCNDISQNVCNLHSSCAHDFLPYITHATPPRLVSLKSGTWMSTLLPLRSRILPVKVPKPGNQKRLPWTSHGTPTLWRSLNFCSALRLRWIIDENENSICVN